LPHFEAVGPGVVKQVYFGVELSNIRRLTGWTELILWTQSRPSPQLQLIAFAL
jgi:hypothetical protein